MSDKYLIYNNNDDKRIIISIIIPIYNSEKFIETAIQSIKCQLKSWIEVVLVNDGSNDGSDFICKKHISNQIKYHCTDNCGAGHARNIGIDCAKGEWIIFLDSDDLILKNFFNEELLSFLNTCKNNKTDIIYTPKIVADMELKKPPIIEFPENKNEIVHNLPKLEFWTCIYNSDFLKKNKIYFFEYKKQDIETAFRFRAFSNAKNIFIEKNRVFYIHRTNPISNIHTLKLEDYFETKALVYYDLYIEYNGDIETKKWLFMQYLYFTIMLIIRYLHKGGTVDSLNDLYCVIKKSKNADLNVCKMLTIKYKMICLSIKTINIPFFRCLYRFLCVRVSRRPIQNNVYNINEDNTNLIMNRMDKYKEKVDEIMQVTNS